MIRKRNNYGFSMIEIIIVLIILSVMASLAFVRAFKTVEYVKVNEALAGLNAVRLSMERCYTQRHAYADCGAFSNIDVEDPGGPSYAHFSYSFVSAGSTTFTIRATRNTLDGGTAGDQVTLDNDGTVITRSGTSAFAGMQ